MDSAVPRHGAGSYITGLTTSAMIAISSLYLRIKVEIQSLVEYRWSCGVCGVVVL
jgi:hypothetical protein